MKTTSKKEWAFVHIDEDTSAPLTDADGGHEREKKKMPWMIEELKRMNDELESNKLSTILVQELVSARLYTG